MDMRVLIMSDTGDELVEPSVGAARLMFQAMGVPYDEYIANTSYITPNTTSSTKTGMPLLS